MSLILEALRKLDRDKDAPERGFVVMTHLPWGQGRATRSRLLGPALLALALAVAGLAVVLWRSRSNAPAAPAAALPARAPLAAEPSPFAAAIRPSVGESRARVAPPPSDVRPLPPLRSDPAAIVPASRPATGAAPAAAGEIRLNAISRQDGQPVAILNDHLVREGDGFDGIRVLRIGETEVEIEVHGQHRVITF